MSLALFIIVAGGVLALVTVFAAMRKVPEACYHGLH